jgi:hypothetical protein
MISILHFYHYYFCWIVPGVWSTCVLRILYKYFCRLKVLFFFCENVIGRGPYTKIVNLLFQISFHTTTLRIGPCTIFVHTVLNLVWWCLSLLQIAFMVDKEPLAFVNSCFLHSVNYTMCREELTHSFRPGFFWHRPKGFFFVYLGHLSLRLKSDQ